MKNARLISIRHVENMRTEIGRAQTVGFIFPVHQGGVPEAVKSFIKKLSIQKVSYMYVVVSSGGWELNSLYELGVLLEKKGYLLDYSALHKNVNSNIASVFENAYNISQNLKAEEELETIVNDILVRKKNKFPNRSILKEVQRRFLNTRSWRKRSPDSYFVIGRACNYCGICQEVCGRKNIVVEHSIPEFLHNCDLCLACLQYCPKEAIDVQYITENRKRYHHPFVSDKRMSKNEIVIRDGWIVEEEENLKFLGSMRKYH